MKGLRKKCCRWIKIVKNDLLFAVPETIRVHRSRPHAHILSHIPRGLPSSCSRNVELLIDGEGEQWKDSRRIFHLNLRTALAQEPVKIRRPAREFRLRDEVLLSDRHGTSSGKPWASVLSSRFYLLPFCAVLIFRNFRSFFFATVSYIVARYGTTNDGLYHPCKHTDIPPIITIPLCSLTYQSMSTTKAAPFVLLSTPKKTRIGQTLS